MTLSSWSPACQRCCLCPWMVTKSSSRCHVSPKQPKPPGVVEPERLTPRTHRFIRHRDTPFGEEIFDISEIQVEAMVEPNDVTDDLEWKAVSLAAKSQGASSPYSVNRPAT